MSVVTGVKAHPHNPKWAYISFDEGPEAWCPEFEKAKHLEIGKPLPADWRTDVGEYGPRAFPPKDQKSGGGPAAFRNTKEGFLLEQRSIHRSVALEWAVRSHPDTTNTEHILDFAGAFYEWLSQSSLSPASIGTSDESSQAAKELAPPAAAGDNQSVPLSSREPISGDGGSMGKAPSVPAHTHEWQPSPTLKTFEVCSCGETRKKVPA